MCVQMCDKPKKMNVIRKRHKIDEQKDKLKISTGAEASQNVHKVQVLRSLQVKQRV